MALAAFPRGHGETILLVEDEASAREGCALLLETLGYEVLSTDSGEAALNVFDRLAEEPKLILLDMAMPGMDGAAVCQALQERGATVPIVVLSGYALGVRAHQPPPQGAVGWLQKPLDVGQLAQAVHDALHLQT